MGLMENNTLLPEFKTISSILLDSKLKIKNIKGGKEESVLSSSELK